MVGRLYAVSCILDQPISVRCSGRYADTTNEASTVFMPAIPAESKSGLRLGGWWWRWSFLHTAATRESASFIFHLCPPHPGIFEDSNSNYVPPDDSSYPPMPANILSAIKRMLNDVWDTYRLRDYQVLTAIFYFVFLKMQLMYLICKTDMANLLSWLELPLFDVVLLFVLFPFPCSV